MNLTTVRLLTPRPTAVPTDQMTFAGVDLRRDSGQPIPASFELYNSTRPLYGHLVWQDSGPHGLFWSAIDPDDDAEPLHLAASWRRGTIRLDGWRVLHLDREAELRAWAAVQQAEYADDPEVVAEIARALVVALGGLGGRTDAMMADWLEQSWHAERSRTVEEVEG